MEDFDREITTYEMQMLSDLAEQFKEKPNIAALCQVLAKQLQDVYAFLKSVGVETQIDEATGAQLDNIGKIVGLSRAEAVALAEEIGFVYDDEDELYRLFLKYKMFSNTATGTYLDVKAAVNMICGGTVRYEEAQRPDAEFSLAYDQFSGIDYGLLGTFPIVKPAGVGVNFYSTTAYLADYDSTPLADENGVCLYVGEGIE